MSPFPRLSTLLGRFLSHDPLGYKDSENLYLYEKSSPIGALDPSGLGSPLSFAEPTVDVGDEVGTVAVKPFVLSADWTWTGGMELKMSFEAHWSPPTTGAWAANSSSCPCTSAVWIQDTNRNSQGWGLDWGVKDALKYGNAWTPTTTGADVYDAPTLTFSTIQWQTSANGSFEVRTKLVCVAGPDSGKTYAVVNWGIISQDRDFKSWFKPVVSLGGRP